MRGGSLLICLIYTQPILAQIVTQTPLPPATPLSPRTPPSLTPSAPPESGVVPVAPQGGVVVPMAPAVGSNQPKPFQYDPRLQSPVGNPAGDPTTGGKASTPLPATDPKRSPVDPKVVNHLEGWEATMRGMTTFAVAATLTRKDLATKANSQFSADIWCMKPNLTRMNLRRVGQPGEKIDPNDMMTYISTGKALYEYDGLRKKLTAIPLGPAGFGNNLLLDLMSGMTARTALERFDITLLKQDANYIYLEVKPVLVRDREEFQTLTLVLCNPGNPLTKGLEYIPRMVVLRQNNMKEETWDFPRPVVNPKDVTELFFKPENPGKDWTVEELKPGPNKVPAMPTGGTRVPTPGSGR